MVFRHARVLVVPMLLVALVVPQRAGSATVPSDEAAIRHALNRLAFGPRPGDIEQLQRIGLATWIEQQLSPDRIPDRDVEKRLAAFSTLALDSDDIAREYFLPARQARRARNTRQADDSMAPDKARNDPAIRKGRQVLEELSSAKLLRAVYSERQLEAVLVDFWFNHFNVFAGKGRTGIYVTEYERETIRPHVLGRFRDLLRATAKSPAMLFYLDNWLSADPGKRGQRGLNENYARELLELHTLGVDGGYTQQDVVEVARAFTGWTLDRPGRDGFRFARAVHDDREKVVLGQRIKAGGGIEDGERVLDIVAEHPSTARHIATKLARRFVSDAPPEALVVRAAARFRETGGNLRDVVRTIVTSQEFFAADARRAKVKTPLEFVTSALRTVGADVQEPRPLLLALRQLGMPLYLCQPPTGYDDTAETWVSSGALVNRMNVALSLGSRHRSSDLDGLRARLLRDALGGDVSVSTRSTVEKATTAQQVIALALGSPEFQKR